METNPTPEVLGGEKGGLGAVPQVSVQLLHVVLLVQDICDSLLPYKNMRQGMRDRMVGKVLAQYMVNPGLIPSTP